ncbi:HET-domain-containing protein, partial [Lindgomyces ingoldianus]
ISWKIMPRTFQEAILFTRSLGIWCIWIDSICIVQDDAEDWRTQYSKMTDIYGNPLLTLAAIHPENCYTGIFAKMSSITGHIKFLSFGMVARNASSMRGIRFLVSIHGDLSNGNYLSPL